METLKETALALLVTLVFISAVFGLAKCDKADTDASRAKADTILVTRHDTLVKLDTVLKTRIKYIDTSRIDTVHDILDHYIPIDASDNDGNQVIASNQLRAAVKWKDSLNTCLEMRKVDSSALDTLGKLAKQVPDTIKITPSVWDRVKLFGSGVLVGAGIRSFF